MARNPFYGIFWLALLFALAWPIAGACCAVGQLFDVWYQPAPRSSLVLVRRPMTLFRWLRFFHFSQVFCFSIQSFAGLIQLWIVLQVRQYVPYFMNRNTPFHCRTTHLTHSCILNNKILSTATQPFEGCFRFVRDITDFLEKLITWPRECGRAIGDCSARCPSPF